MAILYNKGRNSQTFRQILMENYLAVIPQSLGPPRCNILLDNPAIKFVEEVRPFNSIDAFLSDLFGNEQVKIGNTDASTDLVKYEPETKHLNRYESKSITGAEYPGEILFVKGPDPKSDIFSSLKIAADDALLINDPPFENVEDALNELYRVNPTALDNKYFTTREFRALSMVFYPHPIRIGSTAIVKEDLVIEVILSNDIDPEDVKLSIIARMRHRPIRRLIMFSGIKTEGIQAEGESPIIKKISIGEESGPVRLRLFFKRQVTDLVDLYRRGPSIQKPD
jgi:hypothetical protein